MNQAVESAIDNRQLVLSANLLSLASVFLKKGRQSSSVGGGSDMTRFLELTDPESLQRF
jgi:hypothetical protein